MCIAFKADDTLAKATAAQTLLLATIYVLVALGACGSRILFCVRLR